MSAPTEMELNRPIPEPDPAWTCKVAGCREPVPADVEDRPHCEACHVPVCAVHVVTQCHVHLCQQCYLKERSVLIGIAMEMSKRSRQIRDAYCAENELNISFDPNDVQFACERWVKEIGEVL